MGELFLFSVLAILFFVFWRKPKKRILSLIVISEQCITYLLCIAFWGMPFILKSCLGFFYIFVFMAIGCTNYNIWTKIVAKIYLGVGIYHFLIAIEPLYIESFFGLNQNVIHYIYNMHPIINILANVLVVALIVFGGTGFDIRKRSIFDYRFFGFKFLGGGHHSVTHENKSKE